MKKRNDFPLYPGMLEAEKERGKARIRGAWESKPDYIRTAAGISPNYNKFAGIPCEKVLAQLNID